MSIRGRLARLFSAAIVDQALLSGASLVVGLILVRYTPDKDYALYCLLQAALVYVTSAHSALVCQPLAILVPGNTPDVKQQMLGAARDSQRRLLRLILLLSLIGVAVTYLVRALTGSMALIVGFGLIAAWASAERNYVRGVLLIYARVRTLVAADAVFVVVMIAGVLWAAFGIGQPAIWVAVALAASAWAGEIAATRALAKDPGWVTADPGPVWRKILPLGSWSIIGTTIYWLFSRSYNYILATRLDLAAVADVNAIRLMVMPALLVTTGLQGMLTPLAAAWNAEIGLDRLVRRLLGIIAAVGVCDLLYFGFIWIFRAWITVHVFHKNMSDRDPLLMLWCIFTIVALVRDVIVSAVLAAGHLRWLAWQIGFCAVVALSVMWIAIPRWGAAAAMAALLIGELLNLGGLAYLIQRMRRESRLQQQMA
ncbi:MAG TPA: hypothetical protein VGR92_02940 [Steroidobacteraceae bacterium]|nr:hypothetical protein [Steroidobacteraceae bacterium]